jgi:serine/threonine-protein kinase
MGAHERLSPAARIGAYEIRRLLGRGATAAVYEARHVTLGRAAAVKVLHRHLADDRVAAARFLREGRAISRIAHPNVVDVLDVGEEGGTPYLVMSLVEGEDLSEHIRRLRPMSIAAIADCILPVIAGVSAAHDAGIIHRDLKPSNIRLAHNQQGAPVPKVLDFGISKLSDDEASELTETDGALGTASYMAPEQLRSAKHVDVRSDIYALGVILYECVTGTRPFRGANGYEVMHAVLTAPVAPPSSIRPKIPAALDAIVLRAMNREPEERYGAARDLGRALAPFATHPDGWLKDLGRAPRAAVVLSSAIESGEATCTLVSFSDRRSKAGRATRARAAVGLVVTFGALLAAVAHHGVRPVSSVSRLEAASGPAVQLAPAATAIAGPDQPPAEGPEAIESVPPAPMLGQQTPDPARVANESPKERATVPAARDALTAAAGKVPAKSAVVAPREEMGRNGAPILE